MHDLLEGICHMELKLVLHYHVSEAKYFNLDIFNKRIYSFKYGKSDIKNKPSANFEITSLNNLKDHKIKQKAMQTWCLMRIFPFLVLDKLPEDDEHLSLISLLNRINEIVFSHKSNIHLLPYLMDLIIEHETLFRRLFPTVNVINKHHHLWHYPLCMLKVGPLRSLWCMRFEAKHHLFKKYGAVCCNFKNLPLSMARIGQICQCAIWSAGKVQEKEVILNKSITTSVQYASSRNELKDAGFTDHYHIITSKKAELYGTEYRNGLFVVMFNGKIEPHISDFPSFGKIEEIIVINNTLYLWCLQYETLQLNEKLNAYRIERGDKHILINAKSLADFQTFSVWKTFNDNAQYICLRHVLL